MKSFFSVILFLPVIYCCAQSPGTNVPLILSNISEQTGLSDDHVKCVLKDKDGFIWIGTADGLNLVDGSTIRIYRHIESDSASLPGSDIITLTE